MSNFITNFMTYKIKLRHTLKNMNPNNLNLKQLHIIKKIFNEKQRLNTASSFELSLLNEICGLSLDIELKATVKQKFYDSYHNYSVTNREFNYIDTIDGVEGSSYAIKGYTSKVKITDVIKEFQYTEFLDRSTFKKIYNISQTLENDATNWVISSGQIRYGNEVKPFFNIIIFIEDEYAFYFSNLAKHTITAQNTKKLITSNYCRVILKKHDVHYSTRIPFYRLNVLDAIQIEKILKVGDYFELNNDLILKNNLLNSGEEFPIRLLSKAI